jgi:hypothetical protein
MTLVTEDSNAARNVTGRNAPLANAERQRLYRQRQREKARQPAQDASGQTNAPPVPTGQSSTANNSSPQKLKKGKTLLEKTPIEIAAHQAATAPLKRRPGAPSTYDPAIAEELCQRITLREPLEIVCEDPRMPCVATVYSWRMKYPEFAAAYARAREQRAEMRADRIDSYMEDLKAGRLDPHTCRVLIDGEKWQASKEQPRIYGDKVDLTTAGEALRPVDVGAAVEALLAALPSLAPAALPAPAEVIDAEAVPVNEGGEQS